MERAFRKWGERERLIAEWLAVNCVARKEILPSVDHSFPPLSSCLSSHARPFITHEHRSDRPAEVRMLYFAQGVGERRTGKQGKKERLSPISMLMNGAAADFN